MRVFTSIFKSSILLFFVFCSFCVKAQFTEYFETVVPGTITFTSNGQPFTLTNQLKNARLFGNGVDAHTPAAPGGFSDQFIDNANRGALNQVNSIKTTNAAIFTVKHLYYYVSSFLSGTPNTASGSITFRGKLGGVTKFTKTISSGFPASGDYSVFAGFSYLDFSAGTDYTQTNIDELEVQTGGAFVYVAIDNFRFGPASTLPVKLTAFSASKNGDDITLHWQTEQELNGGYFVIQHNPDNTNWQDLDTIPSAGNSSINRQYFYIHHRVSTGKHYYRLKHVDINGYTEYSPTIVVNYRNEATGINIFPNPVNGKVLNLTLGASVERNLHYTIFNFEGKMIQYGPVQKSRESIPLPNLASGLYSITLSNGLQATFMVPGDKN